MEGIGDSIFRRAIAAIGGFDEAVREYLSVCAATRAKKLATHYDPNEIAPLPLAAQIMGLAPDIMADVARALEARGAPRVDLNAGCPSNMVSGRGAGSSLLKNPELLYRIARAMVEAVSIPVTVKMRAGFKDTSLFRENLLAAEAAGVRYLTLHPRTKEEMYTSRARWELIAEAKTIVKIPIVGNGDILTGEDALRMVKDTQCDGLMVGRGSVINPFIFHEIHAAFRGVPYEPRFEELLRFLHVYSDALPEVLPLRVKINKLKALMSYLFLGSDALKSRRRSVLVASYESVEAFLQHATTLLHESWPYRSGK
jgi:tRNA-dihydrouridine synthase C